MTKEEFIGNVLPRHRRGDIRSKRIVIVGDELILDTRNCTKVILMLSIQGY